VYLHETAYYPYVLYLHFNNCSYIQFYKSTFVKSASKEAVAKGEKSDFFLHVKEFFK
jgi:hypothetical protein